MNTKYCDAIIKIGEEKSGGIQPPKPIYGTRRLAISVEAISAMMEGQKKDEVHVYLQSGEHFCVKDVFIEFAESVRLTRG